MKRIKYLTGAALLFAALMVTSCSDFLDVNEDPNNAKTATPKLTLPAGIASAAGRLATNYNIMGSMWVQHWAQNNGSNQYKGYDAYQVVQALNNNDFNEIYSGSLQDLQFTRTESKKEGDWNLYLMGTVMQSYVYQMMADIYDEIPFDEALQGQANFHPHYRNGQDVYDSLIIRINDALSKDFSASTNTNPKKADLLFGGDVDKWIQFANTLKLKLYLRQVSSRPDVSIPGIQALFAEGNFLTENAAMYQFQDLENKSNPLYEADQRKLNTKENLRASKTFMDWLLENGDPRVDKMFIPGSGGQKGIEQGNFGVPTTVIAPASLSRARINPEDTVYFLSAAESYFMQAEVVARGIVAGDAEDLFNKGVTAAFLKYGLANPGIYTYPNGTLEENLKAIAMQKWASYVGSQGLEAFFERNRLGYPEYNDDGYTASDYEIGQLVYPIGGTSGVGNYPKRLLYPETERNRNPNTPAEVPFTVGVWWDPQP